MKTGVVHLHDAANYGLRMDASLHLSEGVRARQKIANLPYTKEIIGKFASRIFFGNRNRRIYVSNPEHGLPFLTGAAIFKSDMAGLKFISRKYTQDIQDCILDRGWVLITRSGTVGKCSFSNGIHKGLGGSEDIIRIVPNLRMPAEVLYAYLSSSVGYSLLTQGTFGSVIQHIEPDYVASIEIPIFPDALQEKVQDLVQSSARLQEEANMLDNESQQMLLNFTGLRPISQEDYNYFGIKTANRKISTFSRNISELSLETINAFNYSERIRKTTEYLRKTCHCLPLSSVLDSNGIFSTGSFPRFEYKSPKSIMLINQSDIFDFHISGKYIAPRGVKTDNLVSQGEIIIAGVGTLGENETFCRVIFANEFLEGKLISGEFIRMKTNNDYPSGYLYAWLHSDYGFRLIRSIQAGTKLCRPIPKLLMKLPVPILTINQMQEIASKVVSLFSKRAQAAQKEDEAIHLIEEEIEKWQES